MKNELFKIKVREQSAKVLEAGKHIVGLARITFTTDRHSDLSGEKTKDNLPPWEDETPQVALTFANKSGVATRRYSVFGYKRMEDLTDAELESDEYVGKSAEGSSVAYACKEKDGKFYRVKSEKRTEGAENILSGIAIAFGAEADEDLVDALQNAVASDSQVAIEIEEREFNGSTNLNIKSVKANSAKVAEEVADFE